MTKAYLERLLERADVAFIHDPIGTSGWGMLRALPAIVYLGINRFTFPKRWRQLATPAQYDFLDYQYELLGEIEATDTSLCAISNQNYEDRTEFTHKPIISRFESSDTDATLVVIGDHRDYDPQGGQRPLRENQFVKHLGSYTDVYQQYEAEYEAADLGCPLADTENLFIQDNAILYRLIVGEELNQTKALFERLPEAPYLPLYHGMSSIFSRKTEPGASPLDSFEAIEGLANWLRRRVEWDRQLALEVARTLNRAVAENERVFDQTYARRHDSVSAAAEVITDHADRSPIHQRYATWFEGEQ